MNCCALSPDGPPISNGSSSTRVNGSSSTHSTLSSRGNSTQVCAGVLAWCSLWFLTWGGKKKLIFYSQYLLAGGRWRQTDDWPLRRDGPERHGGRRKNEDPCQREEEGSTDGLDKEVRAVQQLLRRSLARTRTRVQRGELFGAPRADGFLRRCFSFTFDCEGWKKEFLFLTFKAALVRFTLAPRRRLTAEGIRLSQRMRWERMHPHTSAFILITFSSLFFIPRDFFLTEVGECYFFI